MVIKRGDIMETRDRKSFIIATVYYTLLATIGVIFIKFVLPVIFPFILGFLIAMALKPLVLFLHKRYKINEKMLAIFTTFLFYLLIIFLTFIVGKRLFREAYNILSSLPEFISGYLIPLIEKIEVDFSLFLEKFIDDGYASNYLSNSLGIVSDKLIDFTTNLVTKIVSATPKIVIAGVFTVISSFFFSIDYYKITNFLSKLVPKKHRDKLFKTKEIFSSTVKNMVKGYLIIIAITFFELFIGLTLLKIPNALFFSVLVALLDVLPVIGSGTFLIPFSIFAFLRGRISLGIGLIILYILITVIREIIEPKIIGKHIGLPSIVMLLSIYVGARLFGFLGIIILPLSITVIKEFINNNS